MNKDLILKACKMVSKKGLVATFGLTDGKGYPFVSAVTTIKNDGINEFWISTSPESRKAQIIGKGCKAGLCWHDGDNNISLMGMVEIVTDPQIKKELWLGWMKNFFPGGMEDENYCLIKFTTKKARICIDMVVSNFSIEEMVEALK